MQYTSSTIGVQNGDRKRMEVWWELVRALRGGTTAMRAKRGRYLPPTAAETKDPKLYQARLNATRLLPAYSRAITDLAAMPFQKAPTISGLDDLPEQVQKIETNADRKGTSLWAFFRQIHEDAIDRGLGLFLVENVPSDVVDAETNQTRRMNLQEAEKIDARPYFCRIEPDNLVGFLSKTEYGIEKVTDLRVKECSVEMGAGGVEVTVERIRHWTETDVEVWRREVPGQVITEDWQQTVASQGDTTGYVLEQEAKPHLFPDGIPLVVHYTKKLGTMFAQPPLEDLGWENVAHWQARSQQDDALRYCRSPILAGSKLSVEVAQTKPTVGPGATIADTGESEWRYVEISGAALAAGREQLKEIEGNMRMLAMEPLVSVNGPETATGEVRADVRDKAAAQQWAEGLEWCIYLAFEKLMVWFGEELPEDFDVGLWRDWALLSAAASADVSTMQADVKEGRMTLHTYLTEMKRRGKRSDGFDVDGEIEELERTEEDRSERNMLRLIETERQSKRVQEEPPARPEGQEASASDAPAREPEEQAPDPGQIEPVTFNELTLGFERFVRAGNLEGANNLLKKIADLIQVASLGKVRKQPAAGTPAA